MNQSSKIWMLRRGGELVGPLSDNDIRNFIESGEVSEVDEIQPSCGRWYYLRDRNEFLGAIETQKKTLRTGFERKLASLTETLGVEKEDPTQELKEAHKLALTDPLFQPEGFKVQKPLHSKLNSKTSFSVKKKKTSWKRFVFAASLVFAGGGAVLYGAYQPEIKKNFSFLFLNEVQKDFHLNWKSGDFGEAYKNLKMQEALQTRFPYEYSALLLFFGFERDKADLFIQEHEIPSSSQWKNLNGLQFFYKEALDQAESSFIRASEINKDFLPSIVNLGLVYLKKQEWMLARSYFESAFSRMKKSEGLDEVGFYLALAWAKESLEDTQVKLDQVVSFIQHQLDTFSTYEIELKILLSQLKNQGAPELLHADPYVLFKRRALVEVYQEAQLITGLLCSKNLSTLALDFCKLVGVARGQQALKTEMKASPALAAFWAHQNKEPVKVAAFLAQALAEKDASPIKNLVQAQFCYENGNLICAQKHWSQALEKNPKLYGALAGLAQVSKEQGELKQAQSYLKKGLNLTSLYIPLQKLQHSGF